MATIVEHLETGGHYILLGAGYGMFQSRVGGAGMGNFLADKEEGRAEVLAVCDAGGQVGWFSSKLVRIVSVDGQEPSALLG